MKKGIAALMAVVLVGAAGGGAYYYFYYLKGKKTGAFAGRTSSDSEDAVYVTSVAAIAGLGSGSGQIQRYAGVVVPQETWEAKLESDKKVKETYVQEGDEVKAGDKLFTYDTSEDEEKVAQDQIDIERAGNDIETSKAQIAQLEKQKAKATSSDDQLTYTTQILSEQNSIKQNEYDIKTKQLEIETLKAGIADADVTSKIDGVVKNIAKTDSATSSSDSSSDAYITIMEVGDFRVQGTANEQNIAALAEDSAVLCYSRVDSTQYWKGTITKIKRDSGTSNASSDSLYGSDSASSDNGTSSTNYPFYIELDSSDGLMLGQHLYIELDEGQTDQKEGIWIPDYYVTQEDDGSAWVWAASDKDLLERRQVTLGEHDEDAMTYEIKEGLSEEDYIASPDDAYSEGDPLIFNDSTDGMDGAYLSDQSVYGVYDQNQDGSLDDPSIWDDGSLSWDEEELGDVSFYDFDEDESGSVLAGDDVTALQNAGALPEDQNG